jgi:hypothetical protein
VSGSLLASILAFVACVSGIAVVETVMILYYFFRCSTRYATVVRERLYHEGRDPHGNNGQATAHERLRFDDPPCFSVQ